MVCIQFEYLTRNYYYGKCFVVSTKKCNFFFYTNMIVFSFKEKRTVNFVHLKNTKLRWVFLFIFLKENYLLMNYTDTLITNKNITEKSKEKVKPSLISTEYINYTRSWNSIRFKLSRGKAPYFVEFGLKPLPSVIWRVNKFIIFKMCCQFLINNSRSHLISLLYTSAIFWFKFI